ncbi:MAG: DUF3883 domain-containing protein [Candidatus Ratteibacteria bacterium]|jgi:hypothetical protein
MYEKDYVLKSSDEWIAWLSLQEEQRIHSYLLVPDQLIADYRGERRIARDYQGREILELLQNANDAAAEKNAKGKVKLILSQDGMIIANTGKPFTIGGVQSLRIRDLSPKQNKKNLIGNKGLGFRAVLNWSRKPLILSGALFLTYSAQKNADIFKALKSRDPFLKRLIEEEQSREDEIILPALAFPSFINDGRASQIYDLCEELRCQDYDTVIGMPFDNPASFIAAKNEISLLKPEILLFTDNIEELSLILPEQNETVWKIIEQKEYTKSVEVSSDGVGNPSAVRKWHIFRKLDKVPSDCLDEHNDTLQEYEIIIAVPDRKEDLPEPMSLFSFFPTEVSFPYPVVCHATLELETNRKHPEDNRVNKFIIEEIAALLVNVAECQSNVIDPWCKARIIARTKDIDPLMVRFGFRERLLLEAKDHNILPTLAQCYMKPRYIKLIEAKDLSWLPIKSFDNIVLPTHNQHIKTLINELSIDKLSEGEFRNRLNSIAFVGLESRTQVIAGLIENDLVPSDPPPELLLAENNKIISHSARIYLPPVESPKKFDIPDWLNLSFINKDLRTRLSLQLHVTDQRELRQKLSPFRVNEYALANIAGAIIAEARRRIEANPERTKQDIQDTLIALFLMFPENDEPPKLVETVGMPLFNKKGSLTDARSLYFSAKYLSNGNLLETLYGHCCPENLIAAPEEFNLGFSGADPIYNRFLKWLGVADLPRDTVVEKVEELYLGYVLDSLKCPCNFEEYFTKSQEDVERPQLNKIKSIDHIEGILESDPAAILTWLAVDNRAVTWRYQDAENAMLTDRRGNDINYRHYTGVLPSYIHWKIKNAEWLPVSETRKAKPGLCMYGERALEKILPMPANFKHPLFEKYQIDHLKLRDAWDNAGVLPNISSLTPKQIIRILLELPTADPEGKSAKALYRNILENIEVYRHDWKETVEIFKKKGQMWGRGPDGYKYYPVNDLRHADTDDIPEQLINKINVVDLPKRVGPQKVQNTFGVEPIDHRRIKIEIRNSDKSPRHGTIQYEFQACKPYLYALRQVKTKQYQEISAFKKLDIVLCRAIQVSLAYGNLNLEFSLTEPYKWILKENQAYIFEAPQEDASFRSDIFVDSIGAILASIFRLENGGDFARILRCESNGDRIKLLKRIVGETDFPDIEELKKEFEQAGRQPIITYTPEKKDDEKSQPSTQETKKEDQETAGTQEQTAAPTINLKEMKVNKEDHHPAVTERRQIALRNKSKAETSPITTLRRITDGDICEEKVLIFEASEGRYPIKVSHIQGYEGPRCDIISFQTEDDRREYAADPISKSLLIKRFIEVKGRSNEKGAIIMKGNELDAARIYAEQYYLYRLYEKNNIENTLFILNNPLEHKEVLENIIEIDISRAAETERYQLTFDKTSNTIKDEDSEKGA